jgi:hypothetical protein
MAALAQVGLRVVVCVQRVMAAGSGASTQAGRSRLAGISTRNVVASAEAGLVTAVAELLLMAA